jgi:foldase protein PrsA
MPTTAHKRARPRKPMALAAVALALPALALSACGSNVPEDSVVRVDDALIKKDTFNHWMKIAAIASQGPQEGEEAPKVSIPSPENDFRECVAQKQKDAPEPAKGQPKPTAEQFKQQCKQEYEALRDQVLQLLIQNEWVTQEAERQNITVSDAEVKKAFEEQKKASFPEEKDFQQFLKTSGFTMEDILFRVRLEQISTKLRDKIVKGKDQVSDEQIKEYYEKNKERFAQPERRDLRIVLTKEKSRAEQAKQALENGQSWKQVAQRYSIDEASKGQGGVLLAVAKGQQERALDEAVFAAEEKQLAGPIETQFGWYVFQVQKVTPKSQQSLEQAKATIKSLLASQNQQEALDEFIKNFQEKYRSQTKCAEGFVTQDCDNAPKPKTDTAPPGAQQPGGQPGQPGQPGGPPPNGAVPPGGAPPQGAVPPGGAPPEGEIEIPQE